MQDSNEVLNKAKDFDTLVKACSGATAYKPEEAEPVKTGLDLDRLSEALECVPLHERLVLPKEFLLPKQIAEFEHNAAQRLKAFEEKLRDIVTAEIKPDPAYDDFQQVMVALSDHKGSERPGDLRGDDDDYDDDDEDVDPNTVVDWLDKVLSK